MKKYLFYGLALIIFLILILLMFYFINKNNLLLVPIKEEYKNMEKNITRQPAVAGSFYPADFNELKNKVDINLNHATTIDFGVPKIIMVPHAGYDYSAGVAAQAFKQLIDTGYKKAIILGPSHHFPVSGLVLTQADFWQTPLGDVKIFKGNSDWAKEKYFSVNENIFQPEHAHEIQLPFLQRILPDIEIIPIVVGQLDSNQIISFVQTLKKYIGKDTILIVSVDLSHYHSDKDAKKLDQQTIDDILNFNIEDIINNDEIDAPWAVASVLSLAIDEKWQPKLLQYKNSGDVTGDKSSVVGYVAIAFYPTATESNFNLDDYSQAEKKELLKLARQTLETYLKTGKTIQPEITNPKFLAKRGVFVTLTKAKKLRGCIGYIEPFKSLAEAIVDNAISAAVNDSRFSPVSLDELADLQIEISILTPPQPDTIENIIKYKKGAILQQDNRGATYLPQVWADLSEPEEFFTSLCFKAGLSAECYRDKQTKVSSYQAILLIE